MLCTVLHALERIRDEVSDQGQRLTRFTNRQEIRSTALVVSSGGLRGEVASMKRQMEQLVSTLSTDTTRNTVTIRIQFPDLDFARLSRMAGGFRGLVRLLSGVASLRGSIATLSDGTTTNLTSDDTGNTTIVSLASSISASSVLDAVHNVAVGVFEAFTRWTYIWPFQQGIGRNPDVRIILIDAVGNEMVLQVGMSWNDVHTALLERFRGRAGWNYVESNSYNLLLPGTSPELISVIEPDAWGRTVQAGLTVEMSIVIRQQSTLAQCPYCNLSTSLDSTNRRVKCSGCGESYVASAETHAYIEEVDMDTVDTAEPSHRDPPRSSTPVVPIPSSSGPASRPLQTEVSTITSTSIGSSMPVTNNHAETPFAATSDQQELQEPDDLKLFRSVTVLHSHTVPVIDDLRIWLDSPNPTPIDYDEKRRAGSCEWFFDDSFEDWKAQKGGMYWVSGLAGAGKSIICSSVVDVLQKDPKLLLAYFYFDEGDPKKQDHRGLASSLVFQIGTGSERGVDYLKGRRSPHSPPYEKLLPLLSQLLRRSGPTAIVIDALDECPERAREDLLHLLGHLCNFRSDDDIDLRVLVTSRPEPDIRNGLSSLATHTLNVNVAREHTEDIRNYIISQLFDATSLSYSNWDDSIKWIVFDVLIQRSNGMFLWVVLQVQDLRHCAANDVERALDELPSDLYGTYERILKRFPSKPAMITRARQVFECIAFARESLSAAAVAEILSIDFNSVVPYVVSASQMHTETVILRTCPRLLEIVSGYEGHTIVQFIHRSVKEFLTSATLRQATSSPAHPYNIDKSSAHLTLAKICLTALDVDGALSSVQGYADRHWYDHVSSRNDDTLGELLDSFLHMGSPSFARWEERTHHTMNTAFHWAASLGFYRRVEGMLKRSRPDSSTPADTLVRVRDVEGRTALHVAAGQGCADVCRLLLEHGALVADEDDNGWTPLQLAKNGRDGNQEEVVRVLLEYGARDVSDADAL
ncbi:hypothetical protein PENSPDRAFT_97606 [Peniophora sp. CONT]|nr:hypothetical protein PENSPDRAFT_97606 [Peniophora sp. CONT]